MSNIPFFSVIVPVYNKEPHVCRSINSILNQSFMDFELIIVCDPSTDNSNSEVESISDNRIKVYYRDKPGPGGYAARNLGIKHAKGKWIAFLDADDEWYPNHLKNVIEIIKNNKNAKFISSMRNSKMNGKITIDSFSLSQNKKTFVFITLSDYLENAIKRKRAVGTNSVVIKKDFYVNKIVFPEGRARRSGDLYAWVICIAQARGLIWSPHLASLSNRDSVNMVSKNASPSISLNNQMVYELKDQINEKELNLLKKYANRLIKTAYFEQIKIQGRPEVGLFNAFYWRNDILFCSFWFMFSILPNCLLKRLKK
jgi:glycosyltransferase involved in cell wall biosynthesis